MKRRTMMRAVANARRIWDSHVKAITMAEGIPDSYRVVLLYLRHHPGSSQRNISQFAEVTTSAINQVVKNMLEEGYLQKEADPSDKRNTRLYLTETGINAAERLRKKLDASDDAITAWIGAEKEAELMAFLDQLAEYIRKDLDQC